MADADEGGLVVDLDESYLRCRELHRAHGRTYFLATRLLPAWKRRHVHALYGFTRRTDDIVDAFDGGAFGAGGDRAASLQRWRSDFMAGLAGRPPDDDPILPALFHTVATFNIDPGLFATFLASMELDLHQRTYADYDQLLGYMEGSAAAIGLMMLPILLAPDRGPGRPAELTAAWEPARQLGLAFQLTNFIRDVREDLRRDRVYLPLADLARFGVERADLSASSAGPGVRRLVAFEIERARAHYRAAEGGLALLPPRSRHSIHLASVVYGAILDQVEAAGHDVLAGRAVVPGRQRVAAVAGEIAAAVGWDRWAAPFMPMGSR